MQVVCKTLGENFTCINNDMLEEYAEKTALETVIDAASKKKYIVDVVHYYLLRFMCEVYAYIEDAIECEWEAFNAWLCENDYNVPEAPLEEKLLALSKYACIYSGVING